MPTRPAAYADKPVVGYTDPLSVRPGDTLTVMVSTVAATFNASLVRLRHGDPHPDGPGLRFQTVPSNVDGTHPGRYQPLVLGSYVTVDHHPQLHPSTGFTVQMWIRPTLPARGIQGILTKWSTAGGYGLFLTPDGNLALQLDGTTRSTGAPLRPGEWVFVAATYDPQRGTATLHQRPVRVVPSDPARCHRTYTSVGPCSDSSAPLLLGGQLDDHDLPIGRFNGKISSPRFFGRPLDDDEVTALADGGDPAGWAGLVAAWDLTAGSDTGAFPNFVSADHQGRAVNGPTPAVTGHNWTGRESVFSRARDEYNALYFHEDDLEDAGWDPSLRLAVPTDVSSGIYAVRLRTPTGEDWVPFFVRPAQPRADVLFLAPTLSYLAYANEHSAADNPAAGVDFDLREYYQPEDYFAIDVPLIGLYDHHPDGSGVCFSTWRRPILNMRPHYHLPLVRSAHQLSADLHLTDWLEHLRVPYDVGTDHDLHRDGTDLLGPYRVVVTGSHPEYWTAEMLDAVEEYTSRGGRLMYLGGNGFYWVTSISPARPHVIEVRRGRRGTGTWRSEPGEDHHATTGELGGLWRDRGQSPQRLVGVGMAAQGFDRAQSYRRTPDSYSPAYDWIFRGVPPDSEIGAAGLVMGGAAGLEIDRADAALGTPHNAVVLATAGGFSNSYQHVVEEVASSDSRQGGTMSPDVRADMTYFDTPADGAVFSTGSIAWCGALSHNSYVNPVSTITGNVLRRFLDLPDAPEPAPSELA